MQTIGERLEEARKKKGISIREAAESTKIRGDYLQKFESNHFDIGLTEIYTRGFLRTYANFLKIPSDRIINDYSALGRGDTRPRQPAREVYGRMDISVATSEGSSGGGNPPSETPPEKTPSGQSPAQQPHYPKTGSSLPTGPDPATIFKYLKWGGGGVIVILSLLLLWSLVSGPRNGSSNPSAITNAPSRSAVFGLEALGPVRVTVHRANPDGTDGDVLFSRTLTAGEKHSVPRPGPVFIEASLAQNLQIVLNGRPHNLGDLLGVGSRRGELPAP